MPIRKIKIISRKAITETVRIRRLNMAENKEINNNETRVEELDIVVERILDAPRELVFKLFTEPVHLACWWAPYGFTIPFCTIDLRQDGVWHYCMRSPEGHEHWVKSVYSEIIPPERIVYTSTFADKHANVVEGLPEQQGMLMFSEIGKKTKLTIRITFASADDLRATVEMGFIEGFSETLNQLADYITTIQ
jgi:uncharacterized protein YndB with AHSA1/START domain